jgi:hypothetical protein
VAPPFGIALAVVGMVLGRRHRFRPKSEKWLIAARGMALAAIALSLILAVVYVVLAAEYIHERQLNLRPG